MNTRPYLGTNVTPESADELRHRGILEEGELLLAVFDGVLLDENRRRIGGVALSDFIALTDRRLISWARGLFNDTVDSFTWQDVDVAKAETWDPWHGRVIIAFRLAPVAPRSRRIVVKGMSPVQPESERIVINTLDYMPADDVAPLANMIAWVGDQVVSGMAGETIAHSFAEQFPSSDRHAQAVFLAPEPLPPPPPPRAEKRRKKNWWQRAFGEPEEPIAPDTSNLINAYENRRSSQPAGAGMPSAPVPMPMSPVPSEMQLLIGQPSVYEMSRTIQLMLEAPRRFAHSVRRAGEMMSGATDLVSGLQSPQVRRTAMLGIYQAAMQQEMNNGPLAPMAPVVRAAVRFSESMTEESSEAPNQSSSRRLQIKAAAEVRRSAPADADTLQEAPAPEPVVPASGPVRRSISVRRTEQPAAAPGPVPAEVAPQSISVRRPEQPAAGESTPTPTAAPERRSINVRRVEQPSAAAEQAIPESPPPVIRSVSPANRVPVRRMTVNRTNEDVASEQPPVPVGVSEDE